MASEKVIAISAVMDAGVEGLVDDIVGTPVSKVMDLLTVPALTFPAASFTQIEVVLLPWEFDSVREVGLLADQPKVLSVGLFVPSSTIHCTDSAWLSTATLMEVELVYDSLSLD